MVTLEASETWDTDYVNKRTDIWVTSLVIPWLRLPTSVAGALLPALVGELRSHILHTAAKKKKQNQTNQKTSKTKQKTPKQTNKNTDYMEQVESMSLDFRIQMKGIVLLRWS